MAKIEEVKEENLEKEIEEEVKEEAKEEKSKSKSAKKEETKIVRIPIDPLNKKDLEVIVGINEKYAKVLRGVEQEVSIPVYEQLKNAGLV